MSNLTLYFRRMLTVYRSSGIPLIEDFLERKTEGNKQGGRGR